MLSLFSNSKKEDKHVKSNHVKETEPFQKHVGFTKYMIRKIELLSTKSAQCSVTKEYSNPGEIYANFSLLKHDTKHKENSNRPIDVNFIVAEGNEHELTIQAKDPESLQNFLAFLKGRTYISQSTYDKALFMLVSMVAKGKPADSTGFTPSH